MYIRRLSIYVEHSNNQQHKGMTMQAYIWQCGNRWCLMVKTPSGQYVSLHADHATRNSAVVVAIELGLTLVDKGIPINA